MVAALTERINVGPLCTWPSGCCLSGPLGMVFLGAAPVGIAHLGMACLGVACHCTLQ